MVYPESLPLMRTPRLSVLDWTNAPTNLNGPSVSPKDEIWFLCVCHHISNAVYHSQSFIYSDCIKQTVQLLSVSLPNIFLCCYSQILTPVSCSVGSRKTVFRIATRYREDGSGFEPRGEQDCTHRSRPTPTPAQSPLQGGGDRGCFLEAKPSGLGFDHPPPSSSEVKEKVEICLNLLPVPLWYVIRWTLTLPYYERPWLFLTVRD